MIHYFLYIVGFALMICEPTDSCDFSVSHNVLGLLIVCVTYVLHAFKNKKQ